MVVPTSAFSAQLFTIYVCVNQKVNGNMHVLHFRRYALICRMDSVLGVFQNVYYRIHKSPQPVCLLSQIDLVHDPIPLLSDTF